MMYEPGDILDTVEVVDGVYYGIIVVDTLNPDPSDGSIFLYGVSNTCPKCNKSAEVYATVYGDDYTWCCADCGLHWRYLNS